MESMQWPAAVIFSLVELVAVEAIWFGGLRLSVTVQTRFRVGKLLGSG